MIESEIQKKGPEGEAKQNVRGEKSKLIVAEFLVWLDQQLDEHAHLTEKPFTRAKRYATIRALDEPESANLHANQERTTVRLLPKTKLRRRVTARRRHLFMEHETRFELASASYPAMQAWPDTPTN